MNVEKLDAYNTLYDLFSQNGFFLYFVGGTVRDYLLELELDDLDVVTNARPIDMHKFLSNGDYTFEKYGSVKVKVNGFKFDITTLRKEKQYDDFRHPAEIIFCDSLEEDVLRRDFTINGLYMNHELQIIDLVDGQKDLKNKVIRTIGDPEKRIKEDPLRILRAIRFKVEFNFNIDEKLMSAIKNNVDMLRKLNKDKVIMEIKKSSKPKEILDILNYLNILCYNIDL